MKLKTLLFLEKNKRVLETYQCNRPKMLKKYKVHISFRGSLMFQQGVVEGGGGKKSLKHTVSASQSQLKMKLIIKLIVNHHVESSPHKLFFLQETACKKLNARIAKK